MKPTMLNSSALPREFSRSPMVIAHRGGAGDRPENTLEACAFALENGADALELDIQLTADGVPVVLHDPVVGRTLGAHPTPQIHGARHLTQKVGELIQTFQRESIARSSFLRKIVHQGRRVDIWTVNNPQEMATLLQAGVTGLITDFPQRARTVMRFM